MRRYPNSVLPGDPEHQPPDRLGRLGSARAIFLPLIDALPFTARPLGKGAGRDDRDHIPDGSAQRHSKLEQPGSFHGGGSDTTVDAGLQELVLGFQELDLTPRLLVRRRGEHLGEAVEEIGHETPRRAAATGGLRRPAPSTSDPPSSRNEHPPSRPHSNRT